MADVIVHYVSENWGDALNRPLFNFLAQESCEFKSMFGKGYQDKPHILGVGSILTHAGKHSTVWGSGFIQASNRISNAPTKICAVRGPLSRERLVTLGFECPQIYGDPALLYPLVHNPQHKKKYRWGLIPHYVDANNPFCQTVPNDCLVINVQDPIDLVVDQLVQCERIVSTSLHGLIAADAYKIPSVWIRLSEKIVGGHFKYLDYLQSVDRTQEAPIQCHGFTFKGVVADLKRNLSNGNISLDLCPLIDSCPVIKDETFRRQLKEKVVEHYEA